MAATPKWLKLHTINDINENDILHGSIIIFDWDNTLKLYDRTTKTLSCGVNRERLQRWKDEKECELFILSAITPSWLNLTTILIEVERLHLKDYFVKESDTVEIKFGKYARLGNIVICGYDKAETFLEISNNFRTAHSNQTFEEESNPKSCINKWNKVVFFDDEEINLTNFSCQVNGSQCCLVK